MKQKTNKLYLNFDHSRKTEEARQSDFEDEAELKALEDKLKKRKK